MKRIILIAIFSIFFSISLIAEDIITEEGKVDSIYKTQKEMQKQQNLIYETLKNNPLQNKKYGIEINLFRLLMWDADMWNINHTFSSTFSLFSYKRDVEIAFPFFYNNSDNSPIRQITLDCQYRKFLGNTQTGFFITGFIRYANLHGEYGDWWDIQGWNDEDNGIGTENKVGIGFGFGYRKFSYKGFYWGTSLNLGRYLIGESDLFKSSPLWYDNDSEFIFNFEFFKFGYAF
jgi:hypothetical protein